MTARAHSVAHRSIVVATRHLQFGLELAELLLQVEEVRTGLEVGIVFGECDQLAECQRQGTFGLRTAGNVVFRQSARSATQTCHFLKHRTFVPGVAFDGLNKIGDELGTTLELDIDAAPGLVRHLARSHQAIEDNDDVQDNRRSDE